jgi:transcriptional regulatory protein LevR
MPRWYNFFFPPEQIKLNSQRYTYFVNHHDKKAVKEVENNKCIMKDCDGKLESYAGDKYEILFQEKKKISLNILVKIELIYLNLIIKN